MADFLGIEANSDEKFMRMALNEARLALDKQEVPIGAVVVAAIVGVAIWLLTK